MNNNESLLVFNGDTYIKPNLKDMINSKYDITLLASFQNNCDRYGIIKTEQDFILDFMEKEKGICDSHINAGCYFFQNLNFFNDIKEKKFSIEDKFKAYLTNNKMGFYNYNEIFIDIGIPEDYNKMKNYVSENHCKSR